MSANVLQRPGEVCSNCKDRWIRKGREPEILVALPTASATGEEIAVCPWCDGDTIKLAKIGNHQRPPEWPKV